MGLYLSAILAELVVVGILLCGVDCLVLLSKLFKFVTDVVDLLFALARVSARRLHFFGVNHGGHLPIRLLFIQFLNNAFENVNFGLLGSSIAPQLAFELLPVKLLRDFHFNFLI